MKTILDFKDHIHTTKIFKDEEGNEIREDRFGKKNTYTYSITFLNHQGGCVVTGDYGSWTFARKFIPIPGEEVYIGYFAEKVRLANYGQKTSEFDSETVTEEIKEKIKGLEDYGYEGKELEEVKEWWEGLLNYTEDEIEYKNEAFRDYNKPDSIECEDIPNGHKGNVQLEIICEAFNEICKRLKK